MYRAMARWADGRVSTCGTRDDHGTAWLCAIAATLEGAIDTWVVSVRSGGSL